VLVHDRAIALSVRATVRALRGPSSFEVTAKVSDKGTVAEVEKVIFAGIAALAKSPPSEAEMARVKNRLALRWISSLEANELRAEELAYAELFWGDASLVNGELDRALAVTSADVSRVVAKYLVPNHRSRVEVKPQVAAGGNEGKKP
jgi:predicted Zn-dependent peptidase